MRIFDVPRFPENNGSDDPGPCELPETGRPPFPSATHRRFALHIGAVDFCTGNTKRRVEFPRNQIDENRKKQLEDHATANQDNHHGRVVEALKLDHEATASWFEASALPCCELLLSFGNVQESGVGGVEKSNSKREIRSHDPILCIGRSHGSDDVSELRTNPV